MQDRGLRTRMEKHCSTVVILKRNEAVVLWVWLTFSCPKTILRTQPSGVGWWSCAVILWAIFVKSRLWHIRKHTGGKDDHDKYVRDSWKTFLSRCILVTDNVWPTTITNRKLLCTKCINAHTHILLVTSGCKNLHWVSQQLLLFQSIAALPMLGMNAQSVWWQTEDRGTEEQNRNYWTIQYKTHRVDKQCQSEKENKLTHSVFYVLTKNYYVCTFLFQGLQLLSTVENIQIQISSSHFGGHKLNYRTASPSTLCSRFTASDVNCSTGDTWPGWQNVKWAVILEVLIYPAYCERGRMSAVIPASTVKHSAM